jgi:hypothetical protein
MDTENLTRLILYALALAMGVASIVLGTLGQTVNLGILLGIAVFCLALAGLTRVNTGSI